MAVNQNAHVVADMIENHYHKGFKGVAFSMSSYRAAARHSSLLRWTDEPHDCKTVACMAGWCVVANARGDEKALTELDYGSDYMALEGIIFRVASEYLGLKMGAVASLLFTPIEYVYEVRERDENRLDSRVFGFTDIHPLHVVAVLRDFADSGEVNWKRYEKPTMDAWNSERGE